ncbi:MULTISPECIES: hypothetical protein [unclassified Pseudomonas]|uniref:hypothetical protein n=1 Tax=unclassified Pseudomonas TaxID=196821 RepID=UPI001CBF1EB5|nr:MULTISPECIES: hypothetical protein [unclassified Pseudomonas]
MHPQIFWFDSKHGNAPSWFDYRTGTTLIHSTITLFSHEAVRTLIAQALLAPTPVAGEPLIIYLQSRLRELYDGLQDIPGQKLPAINDENAWIVRISKDPHIARVTGDHSASLLAAFHWNSQTFVALAAQ